MKRFLTIFPHTENVHLVKDVGMMPYVLHKCFNYDSTLACYNNGDYPYLQSATPGLKLVFLKRRLPVDLINILLFLIQNRKRYDILQLYHLDKNSLLTGYVFKLLNGDKAKVYLKLDANDKIKERRIGGLKRKAFNFLLSKVNLLSVETHRLQEFIADKWGLDIKYIPNGFFDNGEKTEISFSGKKNVILTVGRIGTKPKATEILCEAFKRFAESNDDWKLEILGPIEPSFQTYIDSYIRSDNRLKERVSFLGAVTDRDQLSRHYAQAKIFVLPSRWEGFPLVYLEAARAGCYIVSTNISAAYDITDNERLGSIFPVDDIKALSEVLLKLSNEPQRLEQVCKSIQDHVYQGFYWPGICKQVDHLLNRETEKS